MKNPDPTSMPVADRRCGECLLSRRKIVSDARRDELLDRCARTGEAFLCHKGTIAGEYVVCRGFYDRGLSLSVRLAALLGLARFVRLPDDDRGR